MGQIRAPLSSGWPQYAQIILLHFIASGPAPRYSSDGNAVEFQSIDGQTYKMSLATTP